MNWTLWQIVIAIREVYGVGVNLTAHNYEAPHSEKLWVYLYVEDPIANIYQADPIAVGHHYQSSIWSEPYSTKYNKAPHSKELWGYPYVECHIHVANGYEVDPMADGHSYQSSVWSEPCSTQLRSTPSKKL